MNIHLVDVFASLERKSRDHVPRIVPQLSRIATATAEKIRDGIGGGVSERAARNWFAKFRSGDTSLQSEAKLGRSTDTVDEALKVPPEQNSRRAAGEISR